MLNIVIMWGPCLKSNQEFLLRCQNGMLRCAIKSKGKETNKGGGPTTGEGNEMEDTIPGDGEKVVGLTLGRYGP